MTAVSLQCKVKNHHPEWSNVNACFTHAARRLLNTQKVYNVAFIRWTTHSPKGLSQKDIDLASVCDSIAKDFGELAPEPASCEMKGLTDNITSTNPDCCAKPS